MSFFRTLLLFTIGNFLLNSQPSSGQIVPDVSEDDAIQQKIEKIAEDAGEDVDANTLLDKLNYFREHPINLNRTTRDELKDLMLLDDLQIEAIFSHVQKSGKFIAMEELQTLDELDAETISRILPFVTLHQEKLFETFSFTKLLSDGKHSLLIRGQQLVEKQQGYLSQTTEKYDSNKCYAGSPLKLYTRYRFTYGNRISIGITGEKDAGEQFFKGRQSQGFDFYSGHLFIRGNGFIRTLALGDYQLQYGQGVVLWSGLAFGKSSDVVNLKRNARGILPYTSTDENAFLRGGAVAFGYKKFQLDAFYSKHKIDGNLIEDTLTFEEKISSFQNDGYHRTKTENENKRTVTESVAGAHLSYRQNNLTLGATGVSTFYSNDRIPTPSNYNQYDFSGDKNFNAGIDLSYLYRNVSLFGEAGRSENGGMGYLAGALVSLDPRFSLSLLHRNFDRDYQALKSNAISENSRDQNETGTMAGISARPVRHFQVLAYYDLFRFPWLKYQADAPSHGYEYLVQLNYTPSKTFDAYLRLKQQNKQENVPGTESIINGIQDVVQTNYRFHIKFKISKAVTLANRIEYVTLEKESAKTQKGFMMYQDISYKPMKSKISIALRYVLFDTDSYDTRIYAYENDVLYAYSIPSYYYRGSKYYLLVHYTIVRGIDGWVRFGQVTYANQESISSGLDLIDGPTKSEFKAQLRFQF